MVILPDEYQEVEYIQGRIVYHPAYIDTLYTPTVNTKLRVKFSPDNINQYGFFGTRSDPYRYYCATFSSGARISCGLTVDRWPSKQITISYGSVYDCTIANGQSEINGEIINTPIISADNWSDSVGTIQLWSLQNTAQFTAGATAKYYLCQIWENNTLVHDFIPCYRKSDSVAGMYDLISKTFFTNAGTGEFTIGPKIHKQIGKLELITNLLMAQPHQETITGTNGVATFNTDLEGLMRFAVPLTPSQDLHGMPNPYPAGVSVNLIPDGTDTSNGYVDGYYLMSDDTTTANANLYVSEFFEVDPTVTYTWSNAYNPTNPAICFYDENKNFISGIASAQQMPITFTPPEGAVYARSSQTKYSFQASNPTNCYQVEIGSTATAYRRYSNICPITGSSSVLVCHTGANLIPRKRTNYNRYMSGGQIKGASSFKLFYMRIPPKKNIYFRSNKDNVIAYIALTNSTAINASASQSGTMTYRNTWDMSARDGYNFAAIAKQTPGLTDAGITSGQAMLSFDSYKTFKEPQDNQYISVVFTDPSTGDPMTVYDGTLTLNEDGSADLVSNYVVYNILPSQWTWQSGSHCFSINRSALSPHYKVFGNDVDSRIADIVSNKYKPNTFNNIANNRNSPNYSVAIREYNAQWLALRTDGTNEWTYLNGAPTINYWKHG